MENLAIREKVGVESRITILIVRVRQGSQCFWRGAKKRIHLTRTVDVTFEARLPVKECGIATNRCVPQITPGGHRDVALGRGGLGRASSRSGAAPELYQSPSLELRSLGRHRRELEERDRAGGDPCPRGDSRSRRHLAHLDHDRDSGQVASQGDGPLHVLRGRIQTQVTSGKSLDEVKAPVRRRTGTKPWGRASSTATSLSSSSIRT